MKLNKTAIATIISLGSLIGFSGSVFAHHGMGHNGYGGQYQHRMYNGGYAGNLTAEQQAVRQKAFDEYQMATASLRQQWISKQYEYDELMTNNPVDDQKVLAVGKEIAALRDNIYQHRVTMDTQLAKAGMPLMTNHRGMMGNQGPNCGRGMY